MTYKNGISATLAFFIMSYSVYAAVEIDITKKVVNRAGFEPCTGSEPFECGPSVISTTDVNLAPWIGNNTQWGDPRSIWWQFDVTGDGVESYAAVLLRGYATEYRLRKVMDELGPGQGIPPEGMALSQELSMVPGTWTISVDSAWKNYQRSAEPHPQWTMCIVYQGIYQKKTCQEPSTVEPDGPVVIVLDHVPQSPGTERVEPGATFRRTLSGTVELTEDDIVRMTSKPPHSIDLALQTIGVTYRWGTAYSKNLELYFDNVRVSGIPADCLPDATSGLTDVAANIQRLACVTTTTSLIDIEEELRASWLGQLAEAHGWLTDGDSNTDPRATHVLERVLADLSDQAGAEPVPTLIADLLQTLPQPSALPPVITAPADITTQATSYSGVSVTFTVDVTDDDDTAPTLTCSPVSGSTFAVGASTVTCTAADYRGNTATASFTVTVEPVPISIKRAFCSGEPCPQPLALVPGKPLTVNLRGWRLRQLVSGVVIDGSGEPIKGVTVQLGRTWRQATRRNVTLTAKGDLPAMSSLGLEFTTRDGSSRMAPLQLSIWATKTVTRVPR